MMTSSSPTLGKNGVKQGETMSSVEQVVEADHCCSCEAPNFPYIPTPPP